MIKALFECECCGDKFVMKEEVNNLNELPEPECSSGCDGGFDLLEVEFVSE